ncbi:MAG TPA: GC-type dockerin domain-anchored protein [Phycisphaerales bacterium]|nr:GC-type dockerin domain-anchored protein [Phycisphaerales bacterium]
MRFRVVSAAALAAMAGVASAQPVVVDGVRDAAYGDAKWVQSNPTQFGDNQPVPFDTNVSTGIEVKIPLSVLGGATTVKITAFVNAGCNCFLSNQVLGSLSGTVGNLGGPGGVNFESQAGTQTVTINLPSLPTYTPTLDGQRDASYSGVIVSQENFTGFGNATHGSVSTGGGSELDNLHAALDTVGNNLVLFIGGNLEANGNSLDIFLDTSPLGDNTLQSGGVYGQGRLNNMAGLTFESGFTADFYIGLNGDGSNIYIDAGVVETGGTGWYVGSVQGYGTPTGFTPGDGGAPTITAAIDNSNTGGVSNAPPEPSPDFANGSEFDNLHARKIGKWLVVFVGGNIESSFNHPEFFLDVASGGQRTINAFNMDTDFNAINKQGTGGDGAGCAGLTFDDSIDYGPFEADYWISYGTNGGEHYTNAAVLRTDGTLNDAGNNLDYGAFDGGVKSENNPIDFDGIVFGAERLDAVGSGTNIYTAYAPRTAGLNNLISPPGSVPPVGVPQLLFMTVNNSNIAGVDGFSADYSAAAAVDTGIEFVIDLSEAGWKPSGSGQPHPIIKIAGYINGSGHDFMSNQVLGGLPDGFGNLGQPCAVDFSTIDGDQFIVICPADVDGTGFVDNEDFQYFVAKFEAGEDEADFDASGFVDTDDYDAFIRCFERGC